MPNDYNIIYALGVIAGLRLSYGRLCNLKQPCWIDSAMARHFSVSRCYSGLSTRLITGVAP